MKSKSISHESGQSLILLVIVSAVLIGILALGIDVGNTLAMRRAAQNAADAGALAGARELCVNDDPTQAVVNADAAARNYAQTQNSIYNVISQEATPIVDYAGGEVQVDVLLNYNSFIAGFFGSPNLTAMAVAKAGCFGLGSYYGAIPIVWKCQEDEDGKCLITFSDDDNQCELSDPQDTLYVIADTPLDEPIYCLGETPPPVAGAKPVNCKADPIDPNRKNMIPVSIFDSDKVWAWGALDGTSDTPPLLDDLILGSRKFDTKAHTWIPGITGVKNAEPIYSAFEIISGNIALLPVFSDSYTGSPPPMLHPEDICLPPDCSGNVNQDWYHIISFAQFYVRCAQKSGGSSGNCTSTSAHDAMFNAPGVDSKLDKLATVEGCFIEGFKPGQSGQPGSGSKAGSWLILLTR